MTTRIRGSDVYVVEDIERILSALAGAARRYMGEYGSGYTDALQAVAVAVGGRLDHYSALPAPAPAPARQAPANMTGDDVNITLFNTAQGRLVARDVGYGWIGNDGYTAFWNASDWQQVTVDEARGWGNLVPDDWCVLVRHAYAEGKRRQLTGGRRGMLR